MSTVRPTWSARSEMNKAESDLRRELRETKSQALMFLVIGIFLFASCSIGIAMNSPLITMAFMLVGLLFIGARERLEIVAKDYEKKIEILQHYEK